MNEWLIAASAVSILMIPCMAVCVIAEPPSGLVAVELGGVLASSDLMLLSQGFHRQPFIDLAVVLAAMALVGSLVFARMMERAL
jgi:multisubunit Na+/H+ antiporter MnhF subunit